MIKKIKLSIILLLLCVMVPITVMGADYWTGNGVYEPDKEGETWGVMASEVTKVTSPGTVYSIDDISKYSAYITNHADLIGQPFSKSLYWYNKSRLAYVKLFRVSGGQDISFLFTDNFYVYCAEYDSGYTLLNDGSWYSTGDTCTLMDDTRWILVVFREYLASGGIGIDTEIEVSDIKNSLLKYIIFSPFTYTFKLNGGTYGGSTANFTKERLGVTKMTLPKPTRAGYTFAGWKTSDGTVYTGTLGTDYDENIFGNTTFTAVWKEITASMVVLDSSYTILEQNVGDTIKLTATVYPTTALNKSVSWTSEDESIAKVDSDGVVTAYNTGVTRVYASCGSASAVCTVYVMGFDVSVPASCKVNETYEIQINVYNNGKTGYTGRKTLYLEGDDSVKLYRVGDEDTSCMVLAETGTSAENFNTLAAGEYIANTMETKKVYYRLVPDGDVVKPGDYEGSVEFGVSVK